MLTEREGKEREILEGIKLTKEAESALLKLLRHVLRNKEFPENMLIKEKGLVADFKTLLSYRKQTRSFINDDYERARTELVPEAEALAYVELRQSGDNDLPDWEDRWNIYFHRAMKQLVFEKLGIKEESYG
ncbi:hypothetical protein [uncultured Mediterranean phage uvMED]|nr:hypothetical protein [uncultured Mediterranean phage uvMED]